MGRHRSIAFQKENDVSLQNIKRTKEKQQRRNRQERGKGFFLKLQDSWTK
jgi:hypothetical protein